MSCLLRTWKELSLSVLKSNRKSSWCWWKYHSFGVHRVMPGPGQLSPLSYKCRFPSAQCYEDFIRRSPLDSCILFHEGGHWRELVVRTTSRGHTMAIVTFHPQELGQVSMWGTGPLARGTPGVWLRCFIRLPKQPGFPFSLLTGGTGYAESIA